VAIGGVVAIRANYFFMIGHYICLAVIKIIDRLGCANLAMSISHRVNGGASSRHLNFFTASNFRLAFFPLSR
ncbi:MAG: hypothetical protein ACXVAZ_14875, partial [Mucilaginibacter sp.]